MKQMKKVVIGGIWHETNTFSPVETGLAQFKAYQYQTGDGLLAYFDGTRTELGGFIAESGACGFELVPSCYGAAVPAGPVTLDAFKHITNQILACIEQTPDADAVYLSLHGAMVLETGASGDAILLEAIRVRWPERPLVATFDLHANLNDRSIAAADLLVGYDTFPHVDFFERGQEAAQLLRRMLDTGVRPAKAVRRLPLITVPQMQSTSDQPMLDLVRQMHEFEEDDGVWTCSIVPGFPYSDLDYLGFTVLAYGDPEPITRAVDTLAMQTWRERERFLPQLVPLETAMAELRADTDRSRDPAILVEPAENVGGGAPGDATHLLEALLADDVGPSVVVLWDPEAAQAAAAVGLQGRFQRTVGGHSTPLNGAPVALDGTVVYCDTVTYTRTGSYMTGQRVLMGLTAIVQQGQVSVVLTTERVMPFDSDHVTCLGIVLADQKAITAKSGSAWRAAFGDVAARVFYIDTPGVAASNVSHLPYRKAPRPLYPLDMDTDYTVSGSSPLHR
ncbi:M81 family metallopeptidase [Castellaniella sp.]|uniref:M81 family metallopeptidase n=1 Tax=Castellaniella sp. TaxID=1955812 RepID=UPI003563706B